MFTFFIRMILQNVYDSIVHVRYKVHTVLFENGKGACLFQGCRNRGGRGRLRPPPYFYGSVNPISTRGADYAPLSFYNILTSLTWLCLWKNTEVQSKETETEKVHLYKSAMTFFFLSQFSLPVSFLFSQVFLLLPFVVVVVLSVISQWGETISKVAFIVLFFCPHERIFLQIWYNGIKVVWSTSNRLDETIHICNVFSIIMKFS